MSRTCFQSILSLFFLFAPTTKGGLPARRNEDRALMLPNRTLQIFLSVFFSLLTQEKGRDYQREEMEITRMLPNRTSKSFFSVYVSLLTQEKGRDFQREEMKMEVGYYQIALANHSFILFSLLIQQKR
jgi:hypothetical protein